MGFFKNINASADFEALERYIKDKEWKIDDSAGYLFNNMAAVWGNSFMPVFDVTWSFELINGIYMIDSSIFFDGATYREVHALKDTGVLFQAMIDKKPIYVEAGVKYVGNRHIVIKLIFDINNGDRKITIYEVRRKMKNGSIDPNYNFEHNYMLQQQKLARRHSNSQYRFKK